MSQESSWPDAELKTQQLPPFKLPMAITLRCLMLQEWVCVSTVILACNYAPDVTSLNAGLNELHKLCTCKGNI